MKLIKPLFLILILLEVSLAQDKPSETPLATSTVAMQSPEAQEQDKAAQIVAESSSFKISRQDLDNELRRQLGEQLSYFDKERIRLVETKMLDKILERELLFKESTSNKFAALDSEINQEIAKIEKEIGSKEKFDKALQEKNLSPELLRSYIEKDIAIKKYLESELFSSISVLDDEVSSYYKEHPDEFIAPKQVRARHILLKIPEKAEEGALEKIKEQADSLRKEILASDKTFEEFAKEHSEGPSKAKGGDLGYFTENQMVPAFSEAAFALEVGALSEPVLTRFGYHLIKVEDKRGGEMRTLEEVKDKLKIYLKQKKQADAIRVKLDELRQAEKVIVYIQ